MALTPTPIHELQPYNSGTDPFVEQLEIAVGHTDFGATPKKLLISELLSALGLPDWSEATQQDLLTLLGVNDVVSMQQLTSALSTLVVKETGKSLISDTEITRLASVGQNVYPLSLPASTSVAGRLAGYTPPEGWTVEAGASPLDLLITHNLNRYTAMVTVYSVDETKQLQLNGAAAFTGHESEPNTTLIMGLTNTSVALKIYLIMA